MPLKFNPTKDYKSPLYDIAVEIVKKKFPDIVQRVNSEVTPDFLGGSVQGDTEVLSGKIRVDPYGKNYTTDAVIELVNTILHEATHAEQVSSEAKKTYYGPFGKPELGREFKPGRLGDYELARDSGLKDKSDKALDKAKELKLPSSDTGYESELLANLMAATLMNERGIPAGKTQEAVDQILKMPGVADWVARNKFPQSPIISETPQSFIDKFIELFK